VKKTSSTANVLLRDVTEDKSINNVRTYRTVYLLLNPSRVARYRNSDVDVRGARTLFSHLVPL
jgi:hypothetical protein